MSISEIQVIPIKPQDGLVAFVSFDLDNCLYLGSIDIITRPQGGYRLTYPTKKVDKIIQEFWADTSLTVSPKRYFYILKELKSRIFEMRRSFHE